MVTSRLRATWLADAAEPLGLATFMHAAGISCSQRLGDLVAGLEPAGWWQLIGALSAVPRVLVWDGEGELTGDCQAFRGTLGTRVIICRPADPEAKGLVERLHDYLERSFLPGRDFECPADFNTQLGQFLAVARTRLRRALGCSPADRIAADKQAMLALPVTKDRPAPMYL